MYCPECGADAGDVRFCPECGADLSAVRGAMRPAQGAALHRAAHDSAAAGPPSAARRGPSAALLWGVIGVVAAAVVAAVLVFQPAGSSPGNVSPEGDANGAVAAIEADTDGSYDELVRRANSLFDQGDALFHQNQIDQGAQYFAAAAEVYAAAWKKEPGDPNVGTDWATALFYSGDIEGAIARIDVVLGRDPGFQIAWFNKGNYLAHVARITMQGDDATRARRLFTEARRAYLKAAALDLQSEVGQEADRRARALGD